MNLLYPLNTANFSGHTDRCWIGKLQPEGDLWEQISAVCIRQALQQALFFFTGSVSCATFGVFDQQQEVYVTHQVKGNFDVVSCYGHILPQASDQPLRNLSIMAQVLLADHTGAVRGGRLLSPTRVYDGLLTLIQLQADD